MLLQLRLQIIQPLNLQEYGKKMFIKLDKNRNIIQEISDPLNEDKHLPLDFNGGEVNGFIFEKIHPTNAPERDFYQYVVEDTPLYKDGEWYQQWKIVDMDENEKAITLNIFISQKRELRNSLLRESDWTQLPDSELTDDEKAKWAKFRSELRALFDNKIDVNTFSMPLPPVKANWSQPVYEALYEI